MILYRPFACAPMADSLTDRLCSVPNFKFFVSIPLPLGGVRGGPAASQSNDSLTRGLDGRAPFLDVERGPILRLKQKRRDNSNPEGNSELKRRAAIEAARTY